MGLAFWLLESFPDLGSSGLVAIQSFEAGGASTEGVHWLMIWDLGAGSEFTVLLHLLSEERGVWVWGSEVRDTEVGA